MSHLQVKHLVSTNVGQAVDMIRDNFNAFKADKIDQEILADLIFLKFILGIIN